VAKSKRLQTQHVKQDSLSNTFMTDTPTMTETETPEVVAETAAPVEATETAAPDAAKTPERGGRGALRGRGGPGGGRGPRRERAPRERSEFDQATIDVRRVARVMAGGRRFSFSVTVVIGDKKGRVGVGLGKGADTALAIDKAVRDAKKHMITVALTPDNSIAHDVSVKYASSTISIIPSPGRGLVAGSAMRTVLEYAGVTNVVCKILTRTKNKLTIARATVAALKSVGTK
jgi:small subunit ribosomal protein S5